MLTRLKDVHRLSMMPGVEQQSTNTCYLPEMTKNSEGVKGCSRDVLFVDADFKMQLQIAGPRRWAGEDLMAN